MKDFQKEELYGRNSRGLRVLSIKVRDIVFQKKKTSYKEVAEALIEEYHQSESSIALGVPFHSPFGSHESEQSKEEQNIKRRVYDALNVLIATSILRKNGKFVVCDESSMSKDKINQELRLNEAKRALVTKIKALLNSKMGTEGERDGSRTKKRSPSRTHLQVHCCQEPHGSE